MEKYKDSDVELMSILLKLQEQTSPIRMSIGYTVGGTVRQGIILYEAAPKVIETLIEKGYTCDLNGCGMRVRALLLTTSLMSRETCSRKQWKSIRQSLSALQISFSVCLDWQTLHQ